MARSVKETVYRTPIDEPNAIWTPNAPNVFLRFTDEVNLKELRINQGSVVFSGGPINIGKITVTDPRWMGNPDVNFHAIILRGAHDVIIRKIEVTECGGHALDIVSGTANVQVNHFYARHRATDTGPEPPGWAQNWPIHVDTLFFNGAYHVRIRDIDAANKFKGSANAICWMPNGCVDCVLVGGSMEGPNQGMFMRSADKSGAKNITIVAKTPWVETECTNVVKQDVVEKVIPRS
jgi:hypothetical protein